MFTFKRDNREMIFTIKGSRLKFNEKGNEDVVIYRSEGLIWMSYKNGGDLCRGSWTDIGEFIDKNII